jgi:hypothetical protein
MQIDCPAAHNERPVQAQHYQAAIRIYCKRQDGCCTQPKTNLASSCGMCPNALLLLTAWDVRACGGGGGACGAAGGVALSATGPAVASLLAGAVGAAVAFGVGAAPAAADAAFWSMLAAFFLTALAFAAFTAAALAACTCNNTQAHAVGA